VQPPPTRSVETADGTSLAYQVLGDGPVDLVWSFSFLSDVELVWKLPPLADFLGSLATFSRLIIHDRRGMGRSDRPGPADLATGCADLLALLDAVGCDRPALGGPEVGGAMGAVFASTHPDRASALVWYGAFARSAWAPDYPWGATAEERSEQERETLDAWGSEELAARFVAANAPSLAHDPATARFFAHWMRTSTSASEAVQLLRLWHGTDLSPYLATIRVPTLIVCRDAVDDGESAHAASMIPDAELAELPGEDYMPFAGEVDAVVDRIRSFVTGHGASVS
jgi:pimeloyl-ACP methyl ester carboxylesterase